MSDDVTPAGIFDAIKRIRDRDKRYAPEAYAHVWDSLAFAIERIGEPRHVSAQELCVHLCDLARERYGVLAFSILERWGLRSTEDVGSAVYGLIDQHILSEQEGDSPADFSGVFDLRERLEGNYFGRPDDRVGHDPHPG
jgi:uncharacterized repeat protein (TIGR04138 family)